MATGELMPKGVLIPCHDNEAVVEIDASFKNLQKLVGFVEIIRCVGFTLVVDEDGWMKDRPLNVRASKSLYPYTTVMTHGGWLVGDVVVVGRLADHDSALSPDDFTLADYERLAL